MFHPWSWLFFMEMPTVLEGGPSERKLLRDNSGWGQRATVGALPEEVRASLQPVYHRLWRLLAQWARRVGRRI